MKAVFADAFYFVACLNRADQHHNKAASFASQNQRPIVTTTWVLTEVADAFAASTARDRIAGFVAALEGDANTKIASSNAGTVSPRIGPLRCTSGQRLDSDRLYLLRRNGGRRNNRCADRRSTFRASRFQGTALDLIHRTGCQEKFQDG